MDLDDEEKEGLTYIGDAISERLRFEKPHVYVERIVRRKYVAKEDPQRGVVTPPAPLNIVEGSRYDFSVISAILSQKYAFHCPTYRQQDWFAQCGWHPSRSTINELINVSVVVLAPLFWQMWSLLLGQLILMTDDTRLQLLCRNALSDDQQEVLRKRRTSGTPPGTEAGEVNDPGSVTSYAWLYRGLDSLAPYNVFRWSLSHEHAVVDAHLENFRGVLVGDGYSGYTQIEQRSEGRIVHASCNVHARREFVAAEAIEPILSAQALSLYRQIYDVEERGKRCDAQGLYELRQRNALPIWNRFERWLQSESVRRVLPASPLGKAVTYLRNQWSGLTRYLSDGRIPIDNSSDRTGSAPLTVGRANWKFLGHPQAAEGRLQLVSIASSAHAITWWCTTTWRTCCGSWPMRPSIIQSIWKSAVSICWTCFRIGGQPRIRSRSATSGSKRKSSWTKTNAPSGSPPPARTSSRPVPGLTSTPTPSLWPRLFMPGV